MLPLELDNSEKKHSLFDRIQIVGGQFSDSELLRFVLAIKQRNGYGNHQNWPRPQI